MDSAFKQGGRIKRKEPVVHGDIIDTREKWLEQAGWLMAPWFEELNAPLKRFRASTGFTSAGAMGFVLGECWASDASADGHHEIFIDPSQADSERVLDILAHELTHCVVGLQEGHGGAFKCVARGIGLVGPMRATAGGPEFKKRIAPIIERLGPFPHATLRTREARVDNSAVVPEFKCGIVPGGRKQQEARLKKVECPECGYVCRVTMKWISHSGPPICPKDEKPMDVK